MPGDYTYAEKWWGNLFYKIHGKGSSTTYHAAKNQCEHEGAFLATPRLEDENDFIADLIPNENIWIGINDLGQDDLFVAVDESFFGSHISWTKWDRNQPDSSFGYGGQGGVQIVQYTTLGNIPKSWDDVAALGLKNKFVCFRYISRIL